MRQFLVIPFETGEHTLSTQIASGSVELRVMHTDGLTRKRLVEGLKIERAIPVEQIGEICVIKGWATLEGGGPILRVSARLNGGYGGGIVNETGLLGGGSGLKRERRGRRMT